MALKGYYIPTAALLSNGSLLLSGSFTNTGAALVRLRADGSLDESFEAEVSRVILQTFSLQPNGKVLLAPWLHWSTIGFGLARLKADGQLDEEFAFATSLQGKVNAMAVVPGMGAAILAGFFQEKSASPSVGLLKLAVTPPPLLSAFSRVDALGTRFHVFLLTGETQNHYRIETTDDLRTWTPLETVLLTAPTQPVFDFSQASPRAKFYRAVLAP